MKLECDLWEIFVLFCFFFFLGPGGIQKHSELIFISVDTEIRAIFWLIWMSKMAKKYRLILGFVHTILESYFWLAIRYSMNIYPICDSSLKRSARRSFAPSQKSRRRFHATSGFYLELEYSALAFCSTRGSSISSDFSPDWCQFCFHVAFSTKD